VSIAAYIALFGWVPTVLVLFALLPGRRAATVAVIGAWLLLPPYLIPISYFPDYSKNSAATVGMILGTLAFGQDRILAFRPRWFDLPMLAWCFCGLVTSLQNDLGVYDGLSDVLRQSMYWGLPYLLGRLYFGDAEGMRSFAVAMVIGGLAYVLPCLWEMRMSPQLLRNIYGIAGWNGGTRLGGYRPTVFFTTGLELGMWMTAASLTGWWFWRCGLLKRLASIPFGRILLPILLGTTVLCRSSGALVLLTGGIFVLWASIRFKTRIFLVALVLTGPIYVGLRVPKLWSGRQMVDLIEGFSPERAESLGYRFMCEELLVVRALERPVFGWGGWNRSAVYFDNTRRDFEHMVPTDGVWILTLGTKGYVGLSLVYLAIGLPTMLFLRRFPVRLWHHPRVAPLALAATLLGLYLIDCLLNGFINIIYLTLAGGLIGIMPAHLGVGPLKRRESGGPRRLEDQRHRRTVIDPITGMAANSSAGPANDSSRPMTLLTSTSELGVVDQCRSLGRTSKDQGRFAETQIAWQRALDILTRLTTLHPHDVDLRQRWHDCANDLAWLQLNHPDPASRDPASALQLASQVVKQCSDCGVYWNTLGAAYFRAGDFKAAVAALNRAMALGDGGTPFDHIFLAMAHAQLGNRDQSRRWFTQAMVRKDQDYPGHLELARFCDEARSIIAAVPEASAVAH
jgi:tetratricopeptide (TPR) repeat protein